MINSEQLKQNVVKAAEEIRATNPMAGSITNTVTIDFVANAQLAVGGSAAMVYLPDDYDGLVFAAMPQLDNYKDCARRMQLDSIAPEASIMDIDLVDPYNTLFFSICY